MPKFAIEVPVPSMGATVSEMTLVSLVAAPGAAVTKGARLAELESDKSAFDMESPCAGTVLAIHARAGDILRCGAPFFRIETEDAAMSHLRVDAAPAAAPAAVSPAASQPPPAAVPGDPRITPRARKVAEELGVPAEALTSITGTGPGGRVSGDDVAAWARAHPELQSAAPAAAAAPTPASAASLGSETVQLAGLAYALPRQVHATCDLLRHFPGKTEEEIVKLTGIRERYYAGADESATGLAAQAARLALEAAGVPAGEIDAVIMATLIPDQPVPSMASALARELGIRHALAFDLNAACSGWLYALEVGRSFIREGTARKVIVASAELLSRITNPADLATAFLFGDGAGAAVLTGREGGHRLSRMSLSGDSQYYEAIQRTGGGARMPVPAPGADRSPFFLQMDGPVVFKQAVGAFSRMLETTMERHGLRAGDVAWVVPHQANERILRAVSQRVGIPFERFVVTVGRYGNTSAASVSMALGWAEREGLLRSGDRILFSSVGAGFTFAGGLLTW